MPTKDGKLNLNDWAKVMEANQKADKAIDKVEELLKTMKENNKPTNGELALMLKNLTDNVQTGFKGVYDRQDHTNGNVTRNAEGIEKCKKNINKLENWRWYLVGGGSVVMIGLTIFLKFYK